MKTEAVILAGGIGKRLAQAMPKPLLELGGHPLLLHVMRTAAAVADTVHVVHGPDLTQAAAAIATHADIPAVFHLQPEPRGTADALEHALGDMTDDAIVLTLCADVPLLLPETLRHLLDGRGDGLALLTTQQSDAPLGRIIRDEQGRVIAIREHADASDAERQISECNSGVMAAPAGRFREWCARIGNDNAQGERYLTDCISEAVHDGVAIETHECPSLEALGINTPQEYAVVSQHWQERARAQLMAAGALMEMPETVLLSADTVLEDGAAVQIAPFVVMRGTVQLADGARIGAHTLLQDCQIGPNTHIEPFTVVEAARIGARCRVGPYARIRPETELAEDVRVGNFVEIKKSRIASETKINHLSYVGDSEVGARVNLGAGTITCNYDGAQKHVTVIEDDVFVGSGTQLIAPVRVGAGATIGAGSTITRDAPPEALTLSRKKQKTRAGWKRPRKD